MRFLHSKTVLSGLGTLLISLQPVSADEPNALDQLASGSDDERILAALSLGAPDSPPRVVEALARAAHDGSSVVRSAAIRALARTGQPGAVEPLALAMSDDDALVVDEARLALRSIAGPQTAEAIVASYDAHPEARAHLVPALAAVALESTIGKLSEALVDGDVAVRTAADRALRLAPRDVRISALARCLNQPVDAQKGPCLSLAADLHDRSLIPMLAPLATDPFGDDATRIEARKALVAMKDELDAPGLAETARISPSADERAQSLALLAVAGGERSFVALTRGLRDPEETVRARAAWCLGELGDARAVKHLSAMIDEPRNGRIRKVLQGALDRIVRG